MKFSNEQIQIYLNNVQHEHSWDKTGVEIIRQLVKERNDAESKTKEYVQLFKDLDTVIKQYNTEHTNAT